MRWLRRKPRRNEQTDELLAALEHIRAELRLISTVMQDPPKGARPSPVEFPQPLVDASELLARWLWLQLPAESRKDLER